MPGPPPTPTKTLEARGSWRAKIRDKEPRPEVERPNCPAILKGEARREWVRQVKELHRLGLLAKMDRAVLACYCEAWGEFCAAAEYVEKNGRTFLLGEIPKLHPMVKVKNAAAERVLRLAAQFGFSPAARARLQAPETTDVGDPMEKLLSAKLN